MTTASDGSFSVTHDPGACTKARVAIWWDGDATRSSASTSVDVPVNWHRSQLVVTAPSQAWVQDDVDAFVALTVDGEPAAEGVPIHASVRGPDGSTADVSETTGPDGRLPVHFPTAKLGAYTLSASSDTTADTLGAKATATVRTATVPTTVSLAASPSSVVAGKSVELTGSLDRADDRNAGVVVQLIAIDEDGSRRDHFVTTDATGAFSTSDTPAGGGTTWYTARYDGDGLRYEAAADARVSATVLMSTPSLTLRTDRTSYTAGQTAAIFVDIEDSDSRAVTVTAKRSGKAAQVLYQGSCHRAG